MALDLSSRIQAFLFSEGGSLSRKKLMSLLDIKEGELSAALGELSERLKNEALTLIVTDSEVSLALSTDASDEVRAAFERELGKDIGDAGLEVLSIVLYRGPSTRAQIDYIRGVNTSSTIRTLLARGLLERIGNPDDAREYLYRPTVELLAHLGVREGKELPEYDKIASELKNFEAANPFHGDTTDSAHDGTLD